VDVAAALAAALEVRRPRGNGFAGFHAEAVQVHGDASLPDTLRQLHRVAGELLRRLPVGVTLDAHAPPVRAVVFHLPRSVFQDDLLSILGERCRTGAAVLVLPACEALTLAGDDLCARGNWALVGASKDAGHCGLLYRGCVFRPGGIASSSRRAALSVVL